MDQMLHLLDELELLLATEPCFAYLDAYDGVTKLPESRDVKNIRCEKTLSAEGSLEIFDRVHAICVGLQTHCCSIPDVAERKDFVENWLQPLLQVRSLVLQAEL